MRNVFTRVLWLPANLLRLIADREPEAKAMAEIAERQMTMERRREIVRQDVGRKQKRHK
jgi:hypothetical protein